MPTYLVTCARAMARHAELTARTGMKIYFADPHSPWHQKHLDEIADLLNVTASNLGWKFPVEVLAEHQQLLATNNLNSIN